MSEIVITGWPAILLAFVCSSAITWYYIPKVLKVVYKKHLSDRPGNHKIHKRDIPTLGGIGIFAGFIFGFLIGVNGYMHSVSYFTAAAMLLFFVGLKDDLINMNAWKKFGAEIITALIIALFTELHFTSFHGFLGAEEIPAWASYLTTAFLIVLIINAVNLIDGVESRLRNDFPAASSSLNLIAMTARVNPITIEPVSPIKILNLPLVIL